MEQKTPKAETEAQQHPADRQQVALAIANHQLLLNGNIFGMKLQIESDKLIKAVKAEGLNPEQLSMIQGFHNTFLKNMTTIHGEHNFNVGNILAHFVNAQDVTSGPMQNAPVIPRLQPEFVLANETARPTSIMMADIPLVDTIVEYPRGSQLFYIAKCTICNRTFENPQSLHAHINQGGPSHTHLLDNPYKMKSGELAMSNCAIPIEGAYLEIVKAHNEQVHEHRERAMGIGAFSARQQRKQKFTEQ